MDIFNGNKKLEEAIMYGLDWGIFLRHDLDGPVNSYMLLFDENEMNIRVLMTDGDPFEYAIQILQNEEKPFQQFVIGTEGYLRNEKNERIDALLVQGFDKTQDKGVMLGQMFEPKENNGIFRKIDKVTFLNHVDLPIPKTIIENPNYKAEEPGFTGMSIKDGDLNKYVAFFTHGSPSIIANTIKKFLQSKLSGNDVMSLSGAFDLQITPGMISSDSFLKFLTAAAVEEVRNSDLAKKWESMTGRKLKFDLKHGDTIFISELSNYNDQKKEDIQENLSTVNLTNDTSDPTTKYASLTKEALDSEFRRIINIPNARTNISALTEMTELIKEYKNRGFEMPHRQNPTSEKPKPWWKFW